MIKNGFAFFAYTNIIFFVGMGAFYYDIIERPNAIGYFSSAASFIIYLPYYLLKSHCFKKSLAFSFSFCLSLIAILHNINYLIATDYKGHYIIIHKSVQSYSTSGQFQSWEVQVENNKIIQLRLHVPDSRGHIISEDNNNIRLKKGLFGIYFGDLLNGD